MFAVYEGLKEGNRFISKYNNDEEDCKLVDGTVAYKVLHTAETIDECQEFLFGAHHNVFNFTKQQKEFLIRGLALLLTIKGEKIDRESLEIMNLKARLEFD